MNHHHDASVLTKDLRTPPPWTCGCPSRGSPATKGRSSFQWTISFSGSLILASFAAIGTLVAPSPSLPGWSVEADSVQYSSLVLPLLSHEDTRVLAIGKP